MRQISTDDFLLANEAQLIYEKASGFEPVRGNLKHWKGFVGIIEGTEIPIFANIWIQDGFPDIPPFVDITPKVNHPNVEDDGTLSLRILSNWKNNYNIYEVMNDIMDLFTKVPAKTYKTKVKRAKKEERTSGLPIYSIQTRQLPQTQARTIKVDPKIEEEKRSTEESIVSY
ncbi:MAG: ubiquitin-conjugating enzyme E2 variant, partial [Candidatus Heimdallarchaeaceae archaeon]